MIECALCLSEDGLSKEWNRGGVIARTLGSCHVVAPEAQGGNERLGLVACDLRLIGTQPHRGGEAESRDKEKPNEDHRSAPPNTRF